MQQRLKRGTWMSLNISEELWGGVRGGCDDEFTFIAIFYRDLGIH